MFSSLQQKQNSFIFKVLSLFVCFSFSFMTVCPSYVAAQVMPNLFNLPVPGTMISPTSAYLPTMIQGIIVDPDNPLKFQFIIDTGESGVKGSALKDESLRLIKYFLASLTVPEEEMWVNLSPYEGKRIIPEAFGQTDMGMELLAQDYMLKQLTASLMYPEEELGQEFWRRVHERAKAEFGTEEMPVDTYNKVWIVPEQAQVYQKDNSAFVISSHLKVMMEADYTAQNEGRVADTALSDAKDIDDQIIREIIIPEIEKEVNEGQTFAKLRQMYQSMILATWFKMSLKESLLGQIYVDRNKVSGVETSVENAKEKIYQQYLEAFRKGVYNYIKEDTDESTGQITSRKYFSGGFDSSMLTATVYTGLVDGNGQLAPGVSQQIVSSLGVVSADGHKVRLDVDLLEDTSGQAQAAAEKAAEWAIQGEDFSLLAERLQEKVSVFQQKREQITAAIQRSQRLINTAPTEHARQKWQGVLTIDQVALERVEDILEVIDQNTTNMSNTQNVARFLDLLEEEERLRENIASSGTMTPYVKGRNRDTHQAELIDLQTQLAQTESSISELRRTLVSGVAADAAELTKKEETNVPMLTEDMTRFLRSKRIQLGTNEHLMGENRFFSLTTGLNPRTHEMNAELSFLRIFGSAQENLDGFNIVLIDEETGTPLQRQTIAVPKQLRTRIHVTFTDLDPGVSYLLDIENPEGERISDFLDQTLPAAELRHVSKLIPNLTALRGQLEKVTDAVLLENIESVLSADNVEQKLTHREVVWGKRIASRAERVSARSLSDKERNILIDIIINSRSNYDLFYSEERHADIVAQLQATQSLSMPSNIEEFINPVDLRNLDRMRRMSYARGFEGLTVWELQEAYYLLWRFRRALKKVGLLAQFERIVEARRERIQPQQDLDIQIVAEGIIKGMESIDVPEIGFDYQGPQEVVRRALLAIGSHDNSLDFGQAVLEEMRQVTQNLNLLEAELVVGLLEYSPEAALTLLEDALLQRAGYSFVSDEVAAVALRAVDPSDERFRPLIEELRTRETESADASVLGGTLSLQSFMDPSALSTQGLEAQVSTVQAELMVAKLNNDRDQVLKLEALRNLFVKNLLDRRADASMMIRQDERDLVLSELSNLGLRNPAGVDPIVDYIQERTAFGSALNRVLVLNGKDIKAGVRDYTDILQKLADDLKVVFSPQAADASMIISLDELVLDLERAGDAYRGLLLKIDRFLESGEAGEPQRDDFLKSVLRAVNQVYETYVDPFYGLTDIFERESISMKERKAVLGLSAETSNRILEGESRVRSLMEQIDQKTGTLVESFTQDQREHTTNVTDAIKQRVEASRQHLAKAMGKLQEIPVFEEGPDSSMLKGEEAPTSGEKEEPVIRAERVRVETLWKDLHEEVDSQTGALKSGASAEEIDKEAKRIIGFIPALAARESVEVLQQIRQKVAKDAEKMPGLASAAGMITQAFDRTIQKERRKNDAFFKEFVLPELKPKRVRQFRDQFRALVGVVGDDGQLKEKVSQEKVNAFAENTAKLVPGLGEVLTRKELTAIHQDLVTASKRWPVLAQALAFIASAVSVQVNQSGADSAQLTEGQREDITRILTDEKYDVEQVASILDGLNGLSDISEKTRDEIAFVLLGRVTERPLTTDRERKIISQIIQVATADQQKAVSLTSDQEDEIKDVLARNGFEEGVAEELLAEVGEVSIFEIDDILMDVVIKHGRGLSTEQQQTAHDMILAIIEEGADASSLTGDDQIIAMHLKKIGMSDAIEIFKKHLEGGDEMPLGRAVDAIRKLHPEVFREVVIGHLQDAPQWLPVRETVVHPEVLDSSMLSMEQKNALLNTAAQQLRDQGITAQDISNYNVRYFEGNTDVDISEATALTIMNVFKGAAQRVLGDGSAEATLSFQEKMPGGASILTHIASFLYNQGTVVMRAVNKEEADGSFKGLLMIEMGDQKVLSFEVVDGEVHAALGESYMGTFALGAPIVVGRAVGQEQANDVSIQDNRVSGDHLTLVISATEQEGVFEFHVAENSTNGSFVSWEEPVDKSILSEEGADVPTLTEGQEESIRSILDKAGFIEAEQVAVIQDIGEVNYVDYDDLFDIVERNASIGLTKTEDVTEQILLVLETRVSEEAQADKTNTKYLNEDKRELNRVRNSPEALDEAFRNILEGIDNDDRVQEQLDPDLYEAFYDEVVRPIGGDRELKLAVVSAMVASDPDFLTDEKRAGIEAIFVSSEFVQNHPNIAKDIAVYFGLPNFNLEEAQARVVASEEEWKRGGIDLNAKWLDLKIKRDGNGVAVPLSDQPMEELMAIDGFIPVIINVTPVNNLPMLLGLVDENDDKQRADAQPDMFGDDPKARLVEPALS